MEARHRGGDGGGEDVVPYRVPGSHGQVQSGTRTVDQTRSQNGTSCHFVALNQKCSKNN